MLCEEVTAELFQSSNTASEWSANLGTFRIEISKHFAVKGKTQGRELKDILQNDPTEYEMVLRREGSLSGQ